MFNVNKAEEHLNKLLKQYKIKVIRWSKSSCGKAYYRKKEIVIPYPDNVDKFCICMHEIKHVIDGKWGKLYEREYACEMYAIEQANILGFETLQYKERARRYVLMCIAKGHIRRLDLHKINQDVINFCNVNLNEWEGKRVIVSGWGGDCTKDLQINFLN